MPSRRKLVRYLRLGSTTRTHPGNLALWVALAATATCVSKVSAADEARQAEVAQRGAQVMPFALKATTHIFTKTGDGGIQQVLAKDAADTAQIKLIREHLRDMQARFERGDFFGPSHIHGDDMAGLAALKAAKPGAISFAYRDLVGGAELAYRTHDGTLLGALHTWFDAQISDHGKNAVEGQTDGHDTVSTD